MFGRTQRSGSGIGYCHQGSLQGFFRRRPQSRYASLWNKLAVSGAGSILRPKRGQFFSRPRGVEGSPGPAAAKAESAVAEGKRTSSESKERGKNTDLHVQV